MQELVELHAVRPVYNDISNVLANQGVNKDLLDLSMNLGLFFERYANIWSGPTGRWKSDDPPPPLSIPRDGRRANPENSKGARQRFLEHVAAYSRKERRVIAELVQAYQGRCRALWEALKEAGLEVEVLDFTLQAPFVTGLGMAHVLETGFVWDRNLGVPYLPGTSIKGAARAWTAWIGQDDPGEPPPGYADPRAHSTTGDTRDVGAPGASPSTPAGERDTRVTIGQRVFGDTDDSGAGSVVFHDLYPITAPPLRVDVLNPHFGAYYQDGEAPGDWLSPKPVFFLTVPEAVRFQTAIHARRPEHGDDVRYAADCLRAALENLGAGAKTAEGYGIFSVNTTGTPPAVAHQRGQTATPPPPGTPASAGASRLVLALPQPSKAAPPEPAGGTAAQPGVPTAGAAGVTGAPSPGATPPSDPASSNLSPQTTQVGTLSPPPATVPPASEANATLDPHISALIAELDKMDDRTVKQTLNDTVLAYLARWEQKDYRLSNDERSLIDQWLKRIDAIVDRAFDEKGKELGRRKWVVRLRSRREKP